MCLKFSTACLFLLLFNAANADAYVNCTKEILPNVEEIICKSDDLKQKDEVFRQYEEMVKFLPEYMDFKQANKGWELERSRCDSEECIKNIYDRLIKQAEEMIFEYNPQYKKLREDCQALNLPQECETYAYDAAGLNVNFADFQIDPNTETHLRTIKVNRPGKCVNLILTTFEPTVWRIKYFPTTKIKTVILGKIRDGYNQMVQGVEIGTKIYRDRCSVSHEQELPFTGIPNLRKVNKPVIGKEENDGSYWYHPENIDVKAEIRQELANHEAVNQLVREGVLRRITKKDKKFILKTGFSAIDIWASLPNFDMGFNHANCADKLNRHTNSYCNYYFLNKPLKQLPRGLNGVYGITIFVPTDMEPPVKWQDSHTTSGIVRLHATSAELEKHYKETYQ